MTTVSDRLPSHEETDDRTSVAPSVALVTLGCARNDVDSEELAGRLAASGFRLVDEPEDADTVVVNTCGFVESAKKDSIDTLLQAGDLKTSGRTSKVVAVGLPGRAIRQGPRGVAARSRRRARLRRLPRHRRPAALRPRRRDAASAHAAGPPQAAAHQPRRTALLGGRAGRDHAPPAHRRPRPDGAAQAGQRVRPPLHVLRDPALPRLVREPPAGRRARRGSLARR